MQLLLQEFVCGIDVTGWGLCKVLVWWQLYHCNWACAACCSSGARQWQALYRWETVWFDILNVKWQYVGKWVELCWELLVYYFKTRNNICPYVCKWRVISGFFWRHCYWELY